MNEQIQVIYHFKAFKGEKSALIFCINEVRCDIFSADNSVNEVYDVKQVDT